MSETIKRETSFRTALKNQKRRLSATKSPAKQLQENALLPTAHLRAVQKAEKAEKADIRQQHEGQLKSDRQGLKEEEEPKHQSRESTPEEAAHKPRSLLPSPASPYLPRTPSPLTQDENKQQEKPRPANIQTKSPLPPGSPLLCRTPPSPTAKKVREFNRELRRARSFRKSMERSRESSRSREVMADSEEEKEEEMEVSFSIKQHLGGRRGWKIMPESGSLLLRQDALRRVVGMIQQMELSGHAIPERITIKV